MGGAEREREREQRKLKICLRGDGWRDWHCKMHGDIY